MPVTPLQLNRWTLARQLLLEREPLDPLDAIEHLCGLQAQHSPSPYIGLWSRLRDFDRADLETAILEDRVLKATLMRGTLHLVTARQFPLCRTVARTGLSVYADMVRRLRADGVDVDGIGQALVARLRDEPMKRLELRRYAASLLPGGYAEWAGFSILAVGGNLVQSPEDALFGKFQGTTYRVGPELVCDPLVAWREVAAAYLRAFGPASRGDLSQWSGEPVSAFAPALETLDLVTLKAEDGRTLLDLADGARPDPDVPAPLRFLPKWDNVLLAYERRERVLPERYRKTVIRKNGDVLPTFLVGGYVAGAWDAPLRGRAVITLTAFERLPQPERTAVEAEAEALLIWLRPDTDKRDLRWTPES